MKITDVITESFAYDYAEPWGIFEPEDFIAKIKELASDDSNFIDVFLFATDGLNEEWPELHEEVCAILKPYALRYLLKIAKGVNVPEGWDPGDFFNHWVEEEFGNNLKPDWPELQQISDVANRAFAHGKKTKSVNESEESDMQVAMFLGYLDHHNYWQAFNSLIGAYDTNADCLQVWHSDVQAVKSEVIKGLLHVIKHEPDLPVDAIIADMYADLKWPELLTIQKAMQHNKQQKSVPEAIDPDSDPVRGYVQDMYTDLVNGSTDLTVYNLRDYIYDTGSAENLARAIQEFKPELVDLIQKNKHGMIKSILEYIKKDFNYAEKAVLPVLEVLHHLGIHWPELDRIAAAFTQGKANKQANESELTETLKVAEGWSAKYKHSINCSHPKGFSQKAHCAGKRKHNESTEMEMVCEDCGMCETHGNMTLAEIKQRLDAKCWTGKHKAGTKIKGGIRVNNCVPNEDVSESNVFTNARMNAIKAGKDTFVVHGKTYKVTGDTTDERQAEITEDVTATDASRYVQGIEKRLNNNIRNLFTCVIELNSEQRMSDPEFRSQVLALFDKHKPEIMYYMLRNIKHSDSDNVKWLAPGMIKIGIDWPELKTISQALNVKKPDRAVSENDDRYNDAHKQKSEHDARLVSSALEKIRKHITADNAPTVREITSFWDTIYDINVFSYYRMDILQPILEHHKKTIMYMMLYILKHHNMDDPMDEIFTSLRHARIHWPELKTIQQALAQGSKTESVSEAQISEENPVNRFYMMLYWLDKTKLTVADMPEIKPLVDKVKPDVIRALLLSIKHDDQGVNISNALRILDRMQNCGVNWPEIDKIRQGLQHGRNDRNESVTETSDYSDYNTFELLQKKLATIGRKFNKYDEDSEYWVSNGFPQIQGQVYTLAALGGNNQVIHEISIVYNLKSITDRSRPYQIRPKKFISFSKQKLQELLDPRSVIQVFLHLIKTRASDTQMFKQILKDITKLKTKYDWPELDVIYKALEYQLKPKLPAVATEAKDYSKDPFDKWTKRFANDLENKVYWHFAMVLEELAKHMNVGTMRVSDSQWLQAAAQLDLNAHKREIVHSILKNLKDSIKMNSSSNWLLNSMIAQKLILNKLGADWPELDTIVAGVSNNQVNN